MTRGPEKPTPPALWERMIDRRGWVRCPAAHCDRVPNPPIDQYRALRRTARHILDRHSRYLTNRGEYASAYRLWASDDEDLVRAWLAER